jgi:hypothetical protein
VPDEQLHLVPWSVAAAFSFRTINSKTVVSFVKAGYVNRTLVITSKLLDEVLNILLNQLPMLDGLHYLLPWDFSNVRGDGEALEYNGMDEDISDAKDEADWMRYDSEEDWDKYSVEST